MSKLKYLDLFSGIGAFGKAMTNLGIDYELVGFSEIDKWAVQSYCAIHGVDESLNLGDISEIDTGKLPNNIDLITHGSPCQDFSNAGLMKGGDKGSNTRSSLMWETVRIINDVRPKYVIWENVKGVLSRSNKHNFDMYLDELENQGYNNYYKVLNAKDFAIPQNRERIFVVSIRKDVDSGVFNFPDPIDSDITLRDMLDDNVDEKYDVTQTYTEYLQPKGNVVGEVDIGGYEAIRRVYDQDGVAPTLSTMQGGHREPKIKVKEATKKGYDIATEDDSINISFPKSKTRRGRVGKGVAQTLDTQCDQAVLQKIVVGDDIKPSVAKNFEREKDNIGISDKEIYQCECESGWQDNKVGLKVSPTLRAGNSHTSVLDNNYIIRKLTPLECWRLMGFDDEDYWKARKRLEEVFYNGNDRSNSQMYKQAGNSIVVNVLEAIFTELFKEV